MSSVALRKEVSVIRNYIERTVYHCDTYFMICIKYKERSQIQKNIEVSPGPLPILFFLIF